MRTINDLTENEMLLYLSFSGNNVNTPLKSFGGLPFVGSYGLTRNKLIDILTSQVEKHKDWIINHGGEKVEINVGVDRESYNTKTERLEILNSVYDFKSIENSLDALLSKSTAEHIKLTATGRYLDKNGKLAGLHLSDGRQLTVVQCIPLAKAGKIKNLKAVSREGKQPYLAGVGISLEALPSKTV
jgi:hypothetical protein